MPFQWLVREPELCRDARFVDVDYPDLMATKSQVIRETSSLAELIQPKDEPGPGLSIEGEQYYGVGCDLKDLQNLNDVVSSLRDLNTSLILCVAEVSITYMDTNEADALISWARTLSDGMSRRPRQTEFC